MLKNDIEIKNDYSQSLKYIESLYGSLNINKSALKKLHRSIYILLIWKNELNNNKHFKNDKLDYLDEIIFNSIQVYQILSICDKKVFFMLMRNSIDNFIKLCKHEFNLDINRTDNIEDIFNKIK